MDTSRMDEEIERSIREDMKIYRRVFTTPEEKSEIAKRVSKLRASLNPPCCCEKKKD